MIALLAAPSVHAEGLRGLAIGEACAAAVEKELARGSQQTRPPEIPVEANDLVAFSGTHDGHAALLGYRCVDGILASQLITVKLATEGEAQAVFDRQYQALRERFGPPCTDWRKLSRLHRFALWLRGIYYPDLLTGVDWKLGDDLRAQLYTSAMGPGQDFWAVTLSISGPPVIRVRGADGIERRIDEPIECLHGE